MDLVEKILLDLARRYEKRRGGYTRIVKFGPRRGDNAPISLIELLDDGAQPADRKPGDAAISAKASKTATAAEPKQPAKVE